MLSGYFRLPGFMLGFLFLYQWLIPSVTGQSIFLHNTPPIISLLQRHLKIPETEDVGTSIATAQVQDPDDDEITFGIERGSRQDGSEYFTIDEHTGKIYLNKSLQGKAGSHLYFWVTANDGKISSKVEVYIQVVESLRPNKKPAKPPPVIHTNLYRPAASASSFPAVTSPSALREDGTVYTQPLGIDEELATHAEDTKVDVSPTVTTLGVVIIVVTIALIIVIVILIMILVRRRYLSPDKERSVPSCMCLWRSDSDTTQVSVGSLQKSTANNYESRDWLCLTSPGDRTINPWEFPRHRLKIFGILDEGCFGQVWKCEATDIGGLPGNSTVAVKTLKENAGDKEKKDLLSELEIMKMLDPHPHIVRLLGCCTDKDPIFVIMEFVPRGKLQSHLRASRADKCYNNLHSNSQTLTSHDLTSFAYQVAKGMAYLSSKGIIHRDLAARNVLVGHNNVCKVADFGFARDVLSHRVYERKSEGRLPIRWMAPESLYDNVFSAKTDVWSFGVLLWEIVTLGSTPYPGLSAAEVMRQVKLGYRLEKPEHCNRQLYNLMYYCWSADPNQRPTFAELETTLESFLLADIVYIQLDQFPDHVYYNIVNMSDEKL